MTLLAIVGERGCANEFVRNVSSNGKKTRICQRIILSDLPPIVDDLEDIRRLIPKSIAKADVVVDYSVHPDTPYALRSAKKVITTSKCMLPNVVSVNCFCGVDISEEFGVPEFKAVIKGGRIEELQVVKSSPCGAAYHIAEKLRGMPVEKAISLCGLLTQFACHGKGGPDSVIHAAAEIHKAAVERAISL